MPIKCFVLRLAQSKPPQMLIVCTLAQWEDRFNNKMECLLEDRKQSNMERA